MSTNLGSPAVGIAIKAEQNVLADRFKTAVKDCEVELKENLIGYRQKWVQWMSWYGYGNPPEPNNIESQIHRMFFNDLTYRAAVSVRSSVDAGMDISARSATLAYLLDQGYVVSQVLALQKLLDNGSDVISVKRLLKNVEKHRKFITREVYVAGDGLPYDYTSWLDTVDTSDPMVQICGIDAPGLHRFAVSKQLHETFDQLSGKKPDQRTRQDVIPKAIFRTLDSWISGPRAEEIGDLRNKFIAHAANALEVGSSTFNGVSFSQIDELQRAIVRVVHALIDDILSIRIARPIVPYPPLGIFRGLDLPYSPSDAEAKMHQRWGDLSEERNGWNTGILQEVTSSPGLP
ncbi:MAG: hypothetical protein ABSG34_19370 [Candidatus Sulfotelmatobacter sp.]